MLHLTNILTVMIIFPFLIQRLIKPEKSQQRPEHNLQ